MGCARRENNPAKAAPSAPPIRTMPTGVAFCFKKEGAPSTWRLKEDLAASTITAGSAWWRISAPIATSCDLTSADSASMLSAESVIAQTRLQSMKIAGELRKGAARH